MNESKKVEKRANRSLTRIIIGFGHMEGFLANFLNHSYIDKQMLIFASCFAYFSRYHATVFGFLHIIFCILGICTVQSGS